MADPFFTSLSFFERAIARAKATLDYRQLELEARFLQVPVDGSTEHPITSLQWSRFKSWLDTQAASVQTSSHDQTFEDGYRQTTDMSKGSVTWRQKKRLDFKHWIEMGIKIVLSSEVLTPPPASTGKLMVSRTKDRFSYTILNSLARVDLTKVSMTEVNREKTTYEVEVELLDWTRLSDFLKKISYIFCRLHQTEQLYTARDLLSLNSLLSKLPGFKELNRFNRDVLVQARNLKPDEWVEGGIHGNDTAYIFSPKAHGQRKLLVFTDGGVWLIMPPFEFNRLTSTITDLPIAGTILDGESIPEESRDNRNAQPPTSKYWFLAFDCLMVQNKLDIYSRSYNERLMMCKMVAAKCKSSLITVNNKQFETAGAIPEFFAKLNTVLDKIDRHELPYLTDGIMFAPVQSSYNSFSHEIPNEQRFIMYAPDIVKWKPLDELTIDFSIKRVMINGEPHIELYSSQRGQPGPVLWKGTDAIRFDPLTMIDQSHPLTLDLATKNVVEYRWDYNHRWLTPVRLRPDKVVGNDVDVAKQIWNDIFNPITESTLRGTSITWYMVSMIRRLLLQVVNAWCAFYAKGGYYSERPTVYLCIDSWLLSELQVVLYDIWKLVKLHVFTDKEPNLLNKVPYPVELDAPTTIDDTVFWLGICSPWAPPNTHRPRVVIHLDFALANRRMTNLKTKELDLRDVRLARTSSSIELQYHDHTITAFNFDTLVNKDELIDTWTLNYEPFMPVEASELMNLIRVAWFDTPSKLALPGVSTSVATQPQAPRKRTWYLITSDGKYHHLPQPWSQRVESALTLFKVDLKNAQLFTTIAAVKEAHVYKWYETKIIRVVRPVEAVEAESAPSPPPSSRLVLKSFVKGKSTQEESSEEEEVVEPDDFTDLELPVIEDDVVESLTTTWFTSAPVVRIGAIGDGSCFLHALAKGVYNDYQINDELQFRVDFVKRLRYAASYALSWINSEDPGERTYYKSVGGGQLAILGKEYKRNEEEKRESIENFSLKGVRKLLRSSSFLGDEVYALFCELLYINIHIVRATRVDVFKHISLIHPTQGNTCPNVVILGTGTHYETVGVRYPKGIQTVFRSDDIFIHSLNQRAQGYHA